MENISLTKFANFLIIVLHVEIATTFGSKMVAISTRNTIMRKFANFVRLYFLYFTTFRDQNLKFYYFYKALFGNFVSFVWIILHKLRSKYMGKHKVKLVLPCSNSRFNASGTGREKKEKNGSHDPAYKYANLPVPNRLFSSCSLTCNTYTVSL